MAKAKKRKKSRPPKAHWSLSRWLVTTGLKLAFATAFIYSLVALGYYAWAMTFDLSEITRMPERSIVLDYSGKFYSRLPGENRVVVPVSKVSSHFIHALLAREDTRFYKHHGIDPIGILRALVRNFFAGGMSQGASTITQQLARNSFPLGGKTIHRKLVEAALSVRIETELTKEQILETYVNRIYFGSGYYGIEAASQAYFGKTSLRLNLSEAAALAGLIRSPNRISPFNNLKRAQAERDTVLDRMCGAEMITPEVCATTKATPLETAPKPRPTIEENWAMNVVVSEMNQVLDSTDIEAGGLRIITTVDAARQAAAEKSVEARLTLVETMPGFSGKPKSATRTENTDKASPHVEATVIALDNATGGIRAIVGSRDMQASAYNRAFISKRPIGSTIKPFVYAQAFDKGIKPSDKVSDARINASDIPRKYGRYDPSNYDGKFGDMISVREALVRSRNTPAVRVGMGTGIDSVAEAIRRAGINNDPPRFPSMFLGAFEATLRDLTAAFGAFSNGGLVRQPYIIERIEDIRGNVLYRATRKSRPAMSPAAAKITADILCEVVSHGTAASARQLGAPPSCGGKTGTTNDYCDAWFVGFDSKVTCGVWVGFDKPQTIMPGGSGGQLALPIWVDVICSQVR